MTTTLDALSQSLPAPPDSISDELVQGLRESPPIRWVVLDDDPTGTQSVRDLPVLTAWSLEDFRWAFGTGLPAVYVQTNARSLDPDAATRVMDEVVRAAGQVAQELGLGIEFVSRTDSTLRGHFPLDTDVIARAAADTGGGSKALHAVLLVPAFPDAGRVTVDGVHFVCSTDGTAVPAASSPFARDATFGYASSDLRDWVAEKTGRRIRASDVVHLPLTTIRQGLAAVAEVLSTAGGRYVAADALVEDDMRVLAAAVHQLRAGGASFLYRVGPPFVRSLIAQPTTAPLTLQELSNALGPRDGVTAQGGIVVVGSHVPTTTRQLDALRRGGSVHDVELDVRTLLEGAADRAIDEAIAESVDHLHHGTVVVSTSRDVVAGTDERDSLRIARQVSGALVTITQRVFEQMSPRFVIAKGGITSSDIATRALGIRRGMVRGQMLPGIVSLWQSVDGPAEGVPYIVFAGNVGDDDSLLETVERLTRADTDTTRAR